MLSFHTDHVVGCRKLTGVYYWRSSCYVTTIHVPTGKVRTLHKPDDLNIYMLACAKYNTVLYT